MGIVNECGTPNLISNEEVEPSTKKKHLLHSDLGLKQQSRSPNALPNICMICRTKKHQKSNGNCSYERLVACELVDGEQLLQAAKLKQDDAILNPIENRDCVAIEVRYHANCRREYTIFLLKPKEGRPEALYASLLRNSANMQSIVR